MSTRSTRPLFGTAASTLSTLLPAPPRTAVLASQGGGSLTRGAALAIEMMLPDILNRCRLRAASGTSGSAALTAIIVDALNRGTGVEGVIKGFRTLWNAIGDVDTAYGLSRIHKMTTDPVVGRYFALLESFTAAAIAQTGGPTHKTKDILSRIIGSTTYLHEGPVTGYVNYLLRDPLTGKDQHVVARRKELTLDKIVGSGGLDELGNHRVLDWISGRLEIMRDGAYKGGANPVIGTMIEEQQPTDAIVYTLHGPASRIKGQREHNLNTTEIHAELALLRQQYRGRVNFHTIHLDFGDLDHLNGSPEHLQKIADIAREQTSAQLPEFWRSFDRAPAVSWGTAATQPLPRPALAGAA